MRLKWLLPYIIASSLTLWSCSDQKKENTNKDLIENFSSSTDSDATLEWLDIKEKINNPFDDIKVTKGVEIGKWFEEDIVNIYNQFVTQFKDFEKLWDNYDIKNTRELAKTINNYCIEKGYLFIHYHSTNRNNPFIKIVKKEKLFISNYHWLVELFPEYKDKDVELIIVWDNEGIQWANLLWVPVVSQDQEQDISTITNELLHTCFDRKYWWDKSRFNKTTYHWYKTYKQSFEEFCSNAASVNEMVDRNFNLESFWLLEEDISFWSAWSIKQKANLLIDVEENTYSINRKFGTYIFEKYMDDKKELHDIQKYFLTLLKQQRTLDKIKNYLENSYVWDEILDKSFFLNQLKELNIENKSEVDDLWKSIILSDYVGQLKPLIDTFLQKNDPERDSKIAKEYTTFAKSIIKDYKNM